MTALLTVAGLHAGYGHVGVLDGVTIEVPERGFVALIGSNGAGKSTLLRTLSGLLRPTAGQISFGGASIVGQHPAAIVGRGLLQVAEGRRLFRSQSVRDKLQLGLWGSKLNKGEAAARYERVYALFPVLAERPDVPAGILSGGQQQMLAVGQALMQAPRLPRHGHRLKAPSRVTVTVGQDRPHQRWRLRHLHAAQGDPPMRLCIFGAGAIGGFVAAHLAQVDGLEISVVARGAHLAAIRARRLHVRSPQGEIVA